MNQFSIVEGANINGYQIETRVLFQNNIFSDDIKFNFHGHYNLIINIRTNGLLIANNYFIFRTNRNWVSKMIKSITVLTFICHN